MLEITRFAKLTVEKKNSIVLFHFENKYYYFIGFLTVSIIIVRNTNHDGFGT